MKAISWCLLPLALAVYPRLDQSQRVLVMNGFYDPLWEDINVFGTELNYRLGGHDWPGLCQNGTQQSPINLRTIPDPSFQVSSPANSTFQPLIFDNPIIQNPAVDDVEFFNAYYTYVGTVETDVDDSVASQQVLDSFVLHAPSEHTIDGVQYPLSIQLMYTDVVAGGYPTGGYQMEVLFTEGSRSALLDQIINEEPMDLSELFPPGGVLNDYFFYLGSWNFPPTCTEEMPWVIPNYAVPAALDQIDYFTDLYVHNYNFTGGRGNARAVQPLNGRIVTHFVNE